HGDRGADREVGRPILKPDLASVGEIGGDRREGKAERRDLAADAELAQEGADALSLDEPAAARPRSASDTMARQSTPTAHSLSASRRPAAGSPPPSAPIEVTAPSTGSMPASTRASTTPICDQPRAAPPPSASPILYCVIRLAPVRGTAVAGCPAHRFLKSLD